MSASTVRFDTLPHELIAHIATFVEALSVLNLGRTCKTIRSACWDSLVFKQILTASQRDCWRNDSLDLTAIARRAGNDTSIWARYAVADDKAWVLAGVDQPLASRKQSINFLPELAVVKHPFLKDSCWPTATHGPFDYITSHVFSYTMALLSADEAHISQFHSPNKCQYCNSSSAKDDPAFLSGKGSLWTLCTIAINLRDALKVRRSAWPFNNNAVVPHVDFPRAAQIPMQPLDDTYSLPLPFAQPGMDILSNPSSSSSWDNWYRLHTHALFASPDFLTSGTWCGYYTYTHPNPWLDPPMTGIKFRRTRATSSALTQTVSLEALDCRDGIDEFNVRGRLTWDGDVVFLTARKEYKNSDLTWHWHCRLTPFGFVGHWGELPQGDEESGIGLRIHGNMWLWKKKWNGGNGSEGLR